MKTIAATAAASSSTSFNLPVAVKQELWRVLDNHVAAGMTVSYDAVTRACTQMVLECLKAAMAPVGLQYVAAVFALDHPEAVP